MKFATQNVLLQLTLKAFRAVRKDREATQELANDKAATSGNLSVTKRLVPEQVFKAVYTHDRGTAALFHRYTLPWCDAGGADAEGDPGKPGSAGRICRASVFAQLMGDLGRREREREPLVDAAVSTYAQLLAQPEQLRAALGALYSPDDYPPPDEVRRAFGFHVRVMPVPSSDWRVEMQADELAEVRRMAEQQVADAAKAAEAKLAEEITGPLTRVLEMLQKPEGERRILDSTVANLRDIVGRVECLNVTGNPELTAIAEQLKNEALVYSADSLRQSPTARSTVRREAQAALDRIAALTGETGLAMPEEAEPRPDSPTGSAPTDTESAHWTEPTEDERALASLLGD